MGRERKHDSRCHTHHRHTDVALDIGFRGGDRFHPCVVVLVVVFLIGQRRRSPVVRQINGVGRVVAVLFSLLSAVIVIALVRGPDYVEPVVPGRGGSYTLVIMIANLMTLGPVRMR